MYKHYPVSVSGFCSVKRVNYVVIFTSDKGTPVLFPDIYNQQVTISWKENMNE